MLETSIAKVLGTAIGKSGVMKPVQAGTYISQHLTHAYLQDYGTATVLALAEAVSRAETGRPYPQDWDFSRAEVLGWMHTARAKTDGVLAATRRIGSVGSGANLVHSVSSLFGSLVGAEQKNASAVAWLKAIEYSYRTLEIYTTYANASLLLDRLRGSLVQDVDNMVLSAFGETPGAAPAPRPSPPLLGSAELGSAARYPVRQSIDPPSSAPLAAALAACRAAALANDATALSQALENQLLPALDAFESDADRAAERAGARLSCTGHAVQQITSSREAQFDQVQLFLAATMVFLLDEQNYPDKGDPDYLALRAQYVERIDTLTTAFDQLTVALAQADSQTSGAVAPATVVVRNAYFVSGGEPTSWIETSPQSLVLTAVLENVGDAAANGVLADVSFAASGGLSLQGSPTTHTVGTLNPDEVTTLTWDMPYDGPVYDHMEYACVRVASDMPTTPPFEAGPPAFVLLCGAYYPDDDLDGMDDRWEETWGLDDTTSADALLDLDGDGLLNLYEFTRGTSVTVGDTDHDGIYDAFEVAVGLDPLRDDAGEDPDGDGLDNVGEMYVWTVPFNPDSDGDGCSDGLEVAAGSSPLDPTATPPPDALAAFVRDRLADGWQGAGTDALRIDVNRNARLDVGDLVGLLGGAGPALDPTTPFTIRIDDATGAAGSVCWVPVRVTPPASAAGFSLELGYDPGELTFIGFQAAAGLGSHQLVSGLIGESRVVLIGYGDPPARLPGAEPVAHVLFQVKTGLPAGTELSIEAVAGTVADLTGACLENVTLQSGTIMLGTLSRHWNLY
jgi:hypothetical protein